MDLRGGVKVRLEILRRVNAQSEPYLQVIEYTPKSKNDTVAFALSEINKGGYRDESGAEVSRIMWEHSCLQKKCGACAMVINGTPGLACGARLSEINKNGVIRIEPLRKFPVTADLMVDRQVMLDNLLKLEAWLQTQVKINERQAELAYDASRCLQCGCCLEVCPNFYAGGEFYGMAAGVPAARLIAELAPADGKALKRGYDKHIFEGCGKSLSCKSICPAGIETDRMLARSNAAAVWKRIFGRCQKQR